MMKTEYDRAYQWNPPGGQNYPHKLKAKQNTSEPLMTHKRRVKCPEDNVIIGEPLPSQSNEYVNEDAFFVLGDKNKKFHPSVPYRNIKAWDNCRNMDKQNKPVEKKREKPKVVAPKSDQKKKSVLINEAVQTDDELDTGGRRLGDKSTQISTQVPPSLESAIKTDVNRPIKRDFVTKLVHPGQKSEYQSKYAWAEPMSRQPPAFEKGAENRSKLDTQLLIYSGFMSEYQRQYRPYEFVAENRFKRMRPNRSMDDSHIQMVTEGRRAMTPPPRSSDYARDECLEMDERSKLSRREESERNEEDKRYSRRDEDHRLEGSKSRDERMKSSKREAHFNPPRRSGTAPQSTLNPQRFSFPHGRHKRFLTEYSANFDNKWQKLQAESQRKVDEDQVRQAVLQSRWYKEILELRKKAKEYRQRARGTHFSREHLGEIFTKTRRPDEDDERGGRNRRREREEMERSRASSRNNRDSRTNQRRACSADGSMVTPISLCSSNSDSTVVVGTSNSRSPDPRYDHWAGKPSFDNNMLLDEQASHDTDMKQEAPIGQTYIARHTHPCMAHPGATAMPHPERKYTFHRYFNDDCTGEGRHMATIDYDSISRNSSMGKMSSIISSSSRSLALDTLERAKRNRDEALRSKT